MPYSQFTPETPESEAPEVIDYPQYNAAVLALGLGPLHYATKTKEPRQKGWNERNATQAEADFYALGHGPIHNVALRLNGEHDDLDLEANLASLAARKLGHQDLGEYFAEREVQGEPEGLIRHIGVRAVDEHGKPALFSMRWDSPLGTLEGSHNNEAILEVLSVKQILTGGFHPSGDRITPTIRSERRPTQLETFQRAIFEIGATVLYVQAFPTKDRHNYTLHFAGMLSNLGIPGEMVERIVKAGATVAGDDELPDREAAVDSHLASVAKGTRVSGVKDLKKIIRDKAQVLSDHLREKAEELGIIAPTAPRNQKQTTLDTVLNADADFCVDVDGVPYMALSNGDWVAIGSQEWEDEVRTLTPRYLWDKKELMNLRDYMAHKARQSKRVEKVWLRYGRDAGTIWVDLGPCYVRIDSEGWEVCDKPGVVFRRSSNSRPLPIPLHPTQDHPGLPELQSLLHATNDQMVMWVASIFGGIIPSIPKPITQVAGPHGSGKTGAAKIFARLIDPTASGVQKPPETSKDVYIGAHQSAVLAYDNNSRITQERSDDYARVTSGVALSTRSLYTNGDIFTIFAQALVLLTGVLEIVFAEDALSRTLNIKLNPFRAGERESEEAMEARFLEAWPYILGAIYTALSGALRKFDIREKLAKDVRLHDLAQYVQAAEPALRELGLDWWHDGLFVEAITAAQEEAKRDLLTGTNFGATLVSYLREYGTLEGSTGQILQTLENHRDPEGRGICERDKTWPENAHAVSRRFPRMEGGMAAMGIVKEHVKTEKGINYYAITSPWEGRKATKAEMAFDEGQGEPPSHI